MRWCRKPQLDAMPGPAVAPTAPPRDKTERTEDDRTGHGPERSIDRTFLRRKCRRHSNHQ